MVNAIPEHGPIPPHSLPPELSIVVTSTTPGPLALLAVHEPVPAGGADDPLTQIDVNDGDAIRVPRAAVLGFTNVLSAWT
ncbi:hypothetical protein AUF62_01470 [archaeon 13_1_20CM_52_20]|nr:MAG: hypothetical protein AUF62_01470 [archaeon 13_1_20CM_52_20]